MAIMSLSGNPVLACPSCGHDCQHTAKFCSNCGSLIDHQSWSQLHNILEQARAAAPSFAQVASQHGQSRNSELRTEASKLMLLLARERIFLYMHWIFFLSINLIGFWMAFKCYQEFFGDEVSRLMMGFTPLLYINLATLIFIVPIRGTRKEIARLKEKLNYTRFQIEYGHLI